MALTPQFGSIKPHTKIFSSHSDLVSAGYTDASSIDLNATRWFNKTNKVGLVFH